MPVVTPEDRLLTTTSPLPELELSDTKLQLAFPNGDYTVIVTYCPLEGAPEDVTKYQFMKTVAVYKTSTGEELAPGALRQSQYVHYYDPVAISGDTAIPPADAIKQNAAVTCTNLSDWIAVVSANTPLHELLAD